MGHGDEVCPYDSWVRHPRAGPETEDSIYRLVLWNIDLTLVDVTRVTRDAYPEAFRTVTGRRLTQLPQLAGRSESEIFFEALALNGVDVSDVGDSEQLLAPFSAELATAMAARRDQLKVKGMAME